MVWLYLICTSVHLSCVIFFDQTEQWYCSKGECSETANRGIWPREGGIYLSQRKLSWGNLTKLVSECGVGVKQRVKKKHVLGWGKSYI